MVCAFVNMMGLYTSDGLIFGWAYIWNAVSVSNMVGLCTGEAYVGGGGAYSRRFTVTLLALVRSGRWLIGSYLSGIIQKGII